MARRIEVTTKRGVPDSGGEDVRRRVIEDLGIPVESVHTVEVYTIDMDLTDDESELLRRELFTDPITQDSLVGCGIAEDYSWLVEVGFLPGVTDNVGKSAAEGISDTLRRPLDPGETVFTSRQYALKGDLGKDQVEKIASGLLANELIERWAIRERSDTDESPLLGLPIVELGPPPGMEPVDLELDDAGLAALSRERTLALELAELHAIRDYYRREDMRREREKMGLPLTATDVELEALAQTWSEHCKHKIFNARISYSEDSGAPEVIDSIFKTYIRGSTEEIGKRVGWLLSVFHDNAGVIQFDNSWSVVMKVETHNSPSALDPYGGAVTGIVGVNRDPLGTGMGSKLIFNVDTFCFAPPDYSKPLPPRLLHPRRVIRGVHRGVKDGANQSGIPDVNGAILFDERYLGKPLVFCGTGGIMPAEVNGKPSHMKTASPGDQIVMVGGRIGKDGIHGATFSSEELHGGSPATAVQIGDPITQKKMVDLLLEARDRGLYTCITDNGAGGLSSSVGEMAQFSGGCELHLEKAPLKYAGLAPWEILLSEAQERMTIAVPPEKLDEFMELAQRRSVEATVLGRYTDSGTFHVLYDGKTVACLEMEFLHEGLPTMDLEARWKQPEFAEPEFGQPDDLGAALKSVLGNLNVCSKEYFVRQYDHEVQGTSVLKPFQGVENDGPGDAAIQTPVLGSTRGLVVACGICPKYSDIDTYHMMACAIDEAVRNVICVGGRMGMIAGLDNFCWPDPVQSEKTPDGRYKLAQLVRSCRALYDYCTAYDLPCISGKDSMKNDYKIGDHKISIPPTVLFSALGVIEDATKGVSMDVKNAGDIVYVLGETRAELGGSEYFAMKGFVGNSVPTVDAERARKRYEALSNAMEEGLIASCHDASDGGLGVALAESAFAGGLGMKIDLREVPGDVDRDDYLLFSESQSRFVVTVRPENRERFEQIMGDTGCAAVGEVTGGTRFDVIGLGGTEIIASEIAELKEAWQSPLRW